MLAGRLAGAYGGYGCGPIDKTGRGRTPSGLYRGYDYQLEGKLIKNVTGCVAPAAVASAETAALQCSH